MFESKEDFVYREISLRKGKWSCTSDLWSSPANIPYIAITLHWIDDDWNMRSTIIEFMSMNERHTGEAIWRVFTESLSRVLHYYVCFTILTFYIPDSSL